LACFFPDCLVRTSFASADGNLPPAPGLKATIQGDPPRLELSDASGAVVASHPLLADTSHHRRPKAAPVSVINPAGNSIYVLQVAPNLARLDAFDLNTGAALGSHDLPASTRCLQFTSDNSRLMAFGPGDRFTKGKAQKTAVLTVLDPATLRVNFSQSFGPLASTMFYVPRPGRLLAIDAKGTAMWFVDPQAGEAKPIALGGPMKGAMVSSDGTRLLALVRNVNKSGKKAAAGGALNQLDVATGQLLNTGEELPDAEQLIRLGGGDEYWVLRRGRMQRVTPQGELSQAVVPFAAQDRQLGRGLGGRPGLSMAFAKGYAIAVVKRDGSLAHKVALVEPETGRVDSVAPIGRAGVRRLKTAGRWGIIAGLSAAEAWTGMAPWFAAENWFYSQMLLPGRAPRFSDMVVSRDEKTLYAIDPESADVTAVRTDGSVAAILPARCGNFAWLWRPSQGPFVYQFGKRAVNAIDSRDNMIFKRIPMGKGTVAIPMDRRNEFYLCGRTSCEGWDALKAESTGKLDRRKLGGD
jgi:hypothetical protein